MFIFNMQWLRRRVCCREYLTIKSIGREYANITKHYQLTSKGKCELILFSVNTLIRLFD